MRRAPSLISLMMAALLATALGLAWCASWVLSRQGLKAEVLTAPDGPARYSALWHRPQFTSLQPPPLAGERPRNVRLSGYFHPPRAGAWQAALITMGHGSLALGGREWSALPLTADPAPEWSAVASPGRSAALAFDRDPATRFSSDAPQRGGENLSIDLGPPRAVLGVVADAHASINDGPAGLLVEVSGDGKLFSLAGRVGAFPPGQAVAEVFFPPLQAAWLRLTQTGKKPAFFWSAHEIYVIDEVVLAARAGTVELGAAPQAITLTLSSDPGHPAGARGYLLGLVFLRPPGGDWQPLPLERLSPAPQDGPFWPARLALALEPWLLPAALSCLALLLISLYRDWLWREK